MLSSVARIIWYTTKIACSYQPRSSPYRGVELGADFTLQTGLSSSPDRCIPLDDSWILKSATMSRAQGVLRARFQGMAKWTVAEELYLCCNMIWVVIQQLVNKRFEVNYWLHLHGEFLRESKVPSLNNRNRVTQNLESPK
jgi:hypothetical protein